MDVTLTEATRLLNRTPKTIRAWLDAGRFPGARVTTDGIRKWLIPMEDIERILQQKPPQEASNDPTDTTTMSEVIERLEAIVKRLEALEARLSPKDAHPQNIPTIATSPPIDKPAPPMSSDSSTTLPPGYIALVDFWHGLPETTITRYAKGHVTHGQWRHQGRVIKTALSPQQQADLYQVIHRHKAFTYCPDCPHA